MLELEDIDRAPAMMRIALTKAYILQSAQPAIGQSVEQGPIGGETLREFADSSQRRR